MNYKVIALSCSGIKQIFKSGDIVTDADFHPGLSKLLVEKGFLLPEKSENEKLLSGIYKKEFRKNKSKALITVGIPIFASKIAWLAMESLCNQKLSVKWELIIYEDGDEILGENYFKKYLTRLPKCTKIIYISKEERIALSLKWITIAKIASENSNAIILQADDCYSEPTRIQRTYELIESGHDWIHSEKGIFYNFQNKKTMLFNGNGCFTMLNMAVRKTLLENIYPAEQWKGVDGWILRNIQKIKNVSIYIDNTSAWSGGVDTDGFNRISMGRRDLYNKPKFPFKKTRIKIDDLLIPENILKRISKT